MIRTLLFDFGNVVGFFDYQITLDKLAPFSDLPPAAIRRAIVGTEWERAFELGQIASDEFLDRALHQARLRCNREFLAQARSQIFQPNLELCALLPDLQTHYTLLLGSNTNALHARQFRQQFADHLGHFQALVLSHEVGCRKPHEDFFIHCLRLAQAAPQECVFIDDLEDNVQGARQVGLNAIHYRNVNDLKARLRQLGVAIASP